MQRCQRTRAGGIRHAVRAAKVEPVGHAACDHVAEATGERVLGPLREQRCDAFRRLLYLRLGNPGAAHALDPHGPREQPRHRADHLGRRGHAENDARAVERQFRDLAVRGVVEDGARQQQRHQLSNVGGWERVGRKAEGDRVKGNGLEERSLVRVGFDRGLRVGIVVVLNQPVRGRHFLHAIASAEDQPPKFIQGPRLRKKRT